MDCIRKIKEKGRTLKKCPSCGKEYKRKGEDTYYCETCAKEVRRKSSVRERICIECGSKFQGGPRASYCPDCRAERIKAQGRAYARKKRNAPEQIRKMGSIEKCEICGADYMVASARQRYCEGCKKKADLEWQKNHKKEIEYWKQPQRQEYRNKMRETKIKICVECGREFRPHTSANRCGLCKRKREKDMKINEQERKALEACAKYMGYELRDELIQDGTFTINFAKNGKTIAWGYVDEENEHAVWVDNLEDLTEKEMKQYIARD